MVLGLSACQNAEISSQNPTPNPAPNLPAIAQTGSQETLRFPYESENRVQVGLSPWQTDEQFDENTLFMRPRLWENTTNLIAPVDISLNFFDWKPQPAALELSFSSEIQTGSISEIFLDYNRLGTASQTGKIFSETTIQGAVDYEKIVSNYEVLSSSGKFETFRMAVDTTNMQVPTGVNARIGDNVSDVRVFNKKMIFDVSEIAQKISPPKDLSRNSTLLSITFGYDFSNMQPLLPMTAELAACEKTLENNQNIPPPSEQTPEMQKMFAESEAHRMASESKDFAWQNAIEIYFVKRDGSRERVQNTDNIPFDQNRKYAYSQQVGNTITIYDIELLRSLARIEVVAPMREMLSTAHATAGFTNQQITTVETPLQKQGIVERGYANIDFPKIHTSDDTMTFSANISANSPDFHLHSYSAQYSPQYGIMTDAHASGTGHLNFFWNFQNKKLPKTLLGSAYTYMNMDHAYPMGKIRYHRYGGQEPSVDYDIIFPEKNAWYFGQFHLNGIENNTPTNLAFRFLSPRETITIPNKFLFDLSEIKPYLQESDFDYLKHNNAISLGVANVTGKARPEVHVFAIDTDGQRTDITHTPSVEIGYKTTNDRGEFIPVQNQSMEGINVHFAKVSDIANTEQIEIAYE